VAFKLKQRRVRAAPEEWVRCEGAHPPLIDRDLFERVQQRFADQVRRRSDGELLLDLQHLLNRKGRLTGGIIKAQPNLASAETFAQRFGSLDAAYGLIGYRRPPGRSPGYSVVRRCSKQTAIVRATVAALRERGAQVVDLLDGVFQVNGDFTFTIIATRPSTLTPGHLRWTPRFRADQRPDYRLVARLQPIGDGVRDYFIFPTAELPQVRFSLTDQPRRPYSFYRFGGLEALFEMAGRDPIGEKVS
jgi:hypothetical protein